MSGKYPLMANVVCIADLASAGMKTSANNEDTLTMRHF